MNSIEQRIVEMQFNNAQFEQGISQSLNSLDTLGKSLKLDGASRGLEEISAAGNNVKLDHISSAVDGIAHKFSNMSVVAITAISNIVNRAVNAGTELAKSLTIAPIMDGFHEYETNLNSIQTILANTGLEGKKGLTAVNRALDELNHYSDQTIYNFTEMAKNVGTFTAAGVKLDTATAAIKGIANLAAISGSNSEQASAAMYQLSQALAAGRATLEDWNSVVNAGMGGKVFQDALKETARVHGVAIDQMVKEEGSFRLTLQKGWLTSDILTETLSKFTGDLNAKQLKSMGYNEQQIAGILKMGKTATDAATKVKTYSQLISTLQEAVGSGWAHTWQTLFGDFEEARTLFTGINDVLGGFIKESNEARNKVLGDWKELGGRTVLINAISNAFNALISVIKPIRDAFRSIFPATTGKQLYEFTVAIKNFTENLKIGGSTAENIKRTFAGFFAVLDIGWTIIKEVVKTLFSLIGVATKGSGGFLEFTASIGDFLVSVRNAIKNGDGLSKIFDGIGKVLSIPIKLINFLGTLLGSLFSNIDTKGLTDFTKNIDPLGFIIDKIKSGLVSLANGFAPITDKITKFFETFKESTEGLGGLNFDDILNTINTGFFGGLIFIIKNFVDNFSGNGSFVDAVTESFTQLTDTMGAMQNTLRAATLLQIAIAIGILTVSVVALSKIDAAGLTRALTAITVMFTQLLGSLTIFEKISGFEGFARMPLVAAAMILLGVAVNILASAVKKLAELDWNGLSKGLTGVAIILGLLVATAQFMPDDKRLIATGIGITILASGIKILASAVTGLSGLSWEEIAKGLISVGALLGSLTLFTKFADANKGGILQGAGLILLAASIKILASAMLDLSSLTWEEIAKGLVGMAGGLLLIGSALNLIPPSSILSAAAVFIVATSLSTLGDALKSVGTLSWEEIAKGLVGIGGGILLISAALALLPPSSVISALAIGDVIDNLVKVGTVLKSLGSMSWDEVARGLVAMGGALGIIVATLYLMTGAVTGAVSLLIVAGALAILGPIVQSFGKMSWGEIAAGLFALAGVFVILGAAGALLTPVIPTLIGLGVAIALLGTGIALLGAGLAFAGAGVLFLAVGLTTLAAAGTAGTAALVGIITGLSSTIPTVMKQIALGIIAFAQVIATSGPAITRAFTAVLISLLDSINKTAPKIGKTLLTLLTLLLNILETAVPKMVSAGLKILVGFLKGISDNISKIVTLGIDIITKFIDAIANSLPKIIPSGVNLILKFIEGVTKAINNNSERLGRAGADLALAIIRGMVNGSGSGIGQVQNAAKAMAEGALNTAKQALGIHSPSKEFEKIGNYVNEGFLKGLLGNRDQVFAAFDKLKNMLRDSIRSSAEDVDRAEAKLKKLTSARKKDIDAIKKATAALAEAKVVHELTSKAYVELTKNLDDERNKLGKLALQYDQLTDKIKAAQDRLADAKRTRDEYNKSVKDQYSDLPDITGETKLATYLQDLKKQISDTKTYETALAKLRSLGLNDALYKELLAKGPSALPFVQQLLAGGKASVDEINKLQKQLEGVATRLGKTASTQLYQAAVDAAAGFVKGLESQRAAIEKMMIKIADAMVTAIKKKLKIKSPSRVFEELGKYSAEGLARGLSDSSSIIEESTKNLGENAIESLRKSMMGVSDIVMSGLETDPTIRPVLDLTSVKKDAGQIGDMLAAHPISASGSYFRAKLASIDYMTDFSSPQETSQTQTPSLTFNQYNNSPKALSQAEIYRQTNNQLSVVKGARTKNA